MTQKILIIEDEIMIDNIEKALEKQVPKEAHWEGKPMGIKSLELGKYCPICDYPFEVDYNYCPDCGQRLDWRD